MADDTKKRAPKAQVSTALLRDQEAMLLMHGGKDGHQVMWAFVGLILLGRQLNNGGEFRGPTAMFSAAIGFAPKDLERCIDRMNEAAEKYGSSPWVEKFDGGFRLRSFAEYHREWGGARPGAGRKQGDSSRNQDDSSCTQHECSSLRQLDYQDARPPKPIPKPVPDHPVLPLQITLPTNQDRAGNESGMDGGELDAAQGTGWAGQDAVLRFLLDIGIHESIGAEIVGMGYELEELRTLWNRVHADPGAKKHHSVFVYRAYAAKGREPPGPKARLRALRKMVADRTNGSTR